MKEVHEIVARAVILFCLYDRCVVELEVYNGRHYSKQEREDHRQCIWDWLTAGNYPQYMTEEEREFFVTPVDTVARAKVNVLSHQMECIRPLLWSVGMVDTLHDYSRYDIEDYSGVLRVSVKSSLDDLVASCNARSQGEIAFETDLAFLWHWRAMEIGSTPPDGQSWRECILSIFGEKCAPLLDEIPWSKTAQRDFLVGKKAVSNLGPAAQMMFRIIAQWRHYAFEWITGDEAWDEVSIDT